MNLAATLPPQGIVAPFGFGVCSQPESSYGGHVHQCLQSDAYENSGAKVRKISETAIRIGEKLYAKDVFFTKLCSQTDEATK